MCVGGVGATDSFFFLPLEQGWDGGKLSGAKETV